MTSNHGQARRRAASFFAPRRQVCWRRCTRAHASRRPSPRRLLSPRLRQPRHPKLLSRVRVLRTRRKRTAMASRSRSNRLRICCFSCLPRILTHRVRMARMGIRGSKLAVMSRTHDWSQTCVSRCPRVCDAKQRPPSCASRQKGGWPSRVFRSPHLDLCVPISPKEEKIHFKPF